MKALWFIAKKDLLQVLKDRNAFLFSLLMPIILITLVGFIFADAFNGGSGQVNIKLAISNQDNGYIGTSILQAFQQKNSQLNITLSKYDNSVQLQKQVHDGNVDVGVVIPAGTTDTLTTGAASGKPTSNLVQVYTLKNSSGSQTAGQIVQAIVSRIVDQEVNAAYTGSAAVQQVNRVCNQPGNHCAPNTINAAAIAQSVGTASAPSMQAGSVAMLSVGDGTKISSFDQIVPGYAVFFCLFGINLAAGTLLQEKEDGTFRRLLIAPINKFALLGGKMLAQFLLTLVQLFILFAFGFIFFHLHLGSWPAVLLLIIATSFATTGLGMALVSIVKSRRQLPAVVSLVSLTTAAIGGTWIPLILEPQWLQQVSKIGIAGWAMEGLNGVMLLGKDLPAVVPDILGLLGYGLICFLIALRLFRFQQQTAA